MTQASHTTPPGTTGRLPQTIFALVALALWYTLGESGFISRVLLPPLPEVISAIPTVTHTPEFWSDIALTLYEILVAFVLAALLGLAVGYLVGISRAGTREFEPLIGAIYAVPLVLFFPIFVLFFGLGPASKIAMAATIAFFPISLSTITGFSTVSPTLIAAARLMGASSIQMTFDVMIPAALSMVMTGLRMGLIVSMLAVVGTETIVSTGGLGHRMVTLAETMDMAEMYVYILVIVLVALILTSASGLAERKLQERMAVGE